MLVQWSFSPGDWPASQHRRSALLSDPVMALPPWKWNSSSRIPPHITLAGPHVTRPLGGAFCRRPGKKAGPSPAYRSRIQLTSGPPAGVEEECRRPPLPGNICPQTGGRGGRNLKTLVASLARAGWHGGPRLPEAHCKRRLVFRVGSETGWVYLGMAAGAGLSEPQFPACEFRIRCLLHGVHGDTWQVRLWQAELTWRYDFLA